MLGYVKLKDTNEELYESNLLRQFNQQGTTWQKLEYWICYFYFQLIVFIKYHMNMLTIKQISNSLLFIFPLTAKELPIIQNRGQNRKNKRISIQERRQVTKLKKCIKKLKKQMIKYHIESIVVSDNLKEFLNDIELPYLKGKIYKKVHIIQGNGLIPYMIKEILEYVIKKQGKHLALEDVYICIKDNNSPFLENLHELIHEFKTINIVTPFIEKFTPLVQKLEETESTMITLTNNKKKSLKKAHYIINFDFTEAELQKYQIYRRALLIAIQENGFCNSATFDGIQVRQIGIDTGKKIKDFFEQYHLLENCPLSVLYESTILPKYHSNEIKKKMKQDGVKVIQLYGKNGIINEKEYLHRNFI